jgi:phosphoglycerol transferase
MAPAAQGPHNADKSPLRTRFLSCAASAALCGVLLCGFLHLWRADLKVPFTYTGDALYFLSLAKGLTQGDWTWFNSRLGMPFAADWRDFPVYMTVDMAAMRLLALVTNQPGLIVNVYWLFTVLLTAATATFAFLRFHIGSAVAVSLGVVYALQPFVFYRGIAHLNLVFYLAPLLTAGALELTQGRFTGTSVAAPGASGIRRLLSGVPSYLWLACIAQGLSYIYNAVFGCYLFATAMVIGYAARRRARDLLIGTLLIATTGAASLVNLTPSFEYWWYHGKYNPAMAFKTPADAETFALKIRYLLTPISDYRVKAVKSLERRLAAAFPPEPENATARLGSTASLGFVFLLVYGLCRCAGMGPGADPLLGCCAALAIAIVLLATNGGFGALFNALVAPDIRAYNRIIVFLSFLALVPVAMLLTRVQNWCTDRRIPGKILALLLLGLVFFAVADQAATTYFLQYADRQAAFDRDEHFVRQVESIMAPGAMVFQLPYTNFPAEGPPGKMAIYDHSRAYLHSHKYRWSWAAMGGRPEGEWVRDTAAMPAKDMLERLSLAGFSGVWLDRFGYTTQLSPAAGITSLLGPPALVSPDGRLLFYDMRAYAARILQADSPEPLSLRVARAMHPLLVMYGGGFSVEEHDASRRWIWCAQEGTLTIWNSLNAPRRVLLSTAVQGAHPEPEALLLETPAATETLWPTNRGTLNVRRALVLPANSSITIRFHSEGEPLHAPGDSRTLYFALFDCRVQEI